MKRFLRFCGFVLSVLAPVAVEATPVTVNNPSFEIQTPELTSGQWTNNLAPDWTGSGGSNNGNAFMEWLNLAGEDGTDTLGMALGYDVWQDLSATFQANTLYTLTVKAGNRSGSTDAANQSTYGLATATAGYAASRAHNASTIPVGTFADVPPLTFDTYDDPCVAGQNIRVLLQARGAANRSHFDHIRLDAVASTPNGRPVAALDPASGIGAAGATLNGTITDIGTAAPSVIFYYDTSDRGGVPGSWTNSVIVPGTQTGAFSAGISGLQPNTTYYVRARVTNGSGAVWAAPCRSFTTLPTSPTVINVAASNIAGSTATVGANVTATGGQVPDATIYYGPTDGGTTAGSWAGSVSIPALSGTATRNLSGLSPATTYYFRAYAQNAGGSDWADSTATFTTVSVGPPLVENRAADNITGTSAVLRGEVTETGNDPPVITLYWGLTDGGTTPASWTNSRVLGPDSGDFSSMVQGLSQFTTYYYTARAVNVYGTAWATPSRSFTTGSILPTSVVINEIHYDPADVTKREEFIEFYNPTASPIDMSGWIIDDGVSFIFPAGPGSVIPAGGYRVVVENIAAFTAGYPSAPAPAGQWAAGDALSNSGERIRLKDNTGAVVDEVDYKSGFPWPTSAKGGNVSLELIHPSLNNSLGGSWRSSINTPDTVIIPRGSTGWRYRQTPSEPPAAWKQFSFDDTGAEWATGGLPAGFVGGTPFNPAVTFATTLSFGNTADRTRAYYFRKKFTLASPVALAVNIRRDDGAVVWINDDPTPTVVSADGTWNAPYPYTSLAPNATQTGVYLNYNIPASKFVAGDNIIAVEVHQSSTTSGDLLLDLDLVVPGPKGGTPGVVNSSVAASASAAPPAIRDVDHAPVMPSTGQDVVVSALITDPDNVGTVSLSWQVVSPGSYIRLQDAAYNLPANWTTVSMNDAGTGGDAVAGDAVFSATIPATVQQHRRLIRYRITAADSASNSVTIPYPDDEQPNFAYFCYNGVPAWTGAMRPTAFSGFPATAAVTFPSSLIGSIEPYHLIALDTDVATCLYTGPTDSTPYRGTLVYEGKVYDHITFNIRGIGSTRVSGKNKLAFKFLRARDFRARDNWGRQYEEDWNSFGLDANASPWAAVHRGSAGVEEAVTYRIFELGGMNSLRTNYAHLRIIRKAAESAPAGTSVSDTTAGGTVDGQYTSDLWGLYMVLEPTEANFIDERNLPDGNIYAIEGNNGDKKYQSARQVSDGSDWTTFRTQLAQAGQTEAWYRGNLDLNALYTYVGLSRLVGNVDVRPGDNYRFYHNPAVLDPAYPGGHWSIMGYDHDMQFIAGSHWGGTMDGVVVAGAPNAVMAMMRHPNIARDYRNRCRELLSLMGSDAATSAGQIGQLIDEYAQMVNPAGLALTWADLDAHMWNLHPRTAGGGGNTGQSSHKGNFFRGLYLDGTRGGLGGTTQTASWRRELLPGGVDGFSNHEALMSWLTNFSINTYPAATPWTRKATTSGTGFGGAGTDPSTTRQKGYGFKYLEWECLYGGWFNANANHTAGTAVGDLTAAGTTRYAVNGDSLALLTAGDYVLFPDKPAITFTGTAGYPVNDILLHSSDYGDPQNDAITAVQWRVGEISAPGIPLHDPTKPRIYELEELWRSAEIPTSIPTGIADVRVPAGALRVGHTYRARVRHKDSTGRWSLWSEPLQFIPGTPDVSVYVNSLRITEINYNPGAPTGAEIAAPGWNPLWNEQDFEFIELRNVSPTAIDLTDVRFTKGINFDFTAGTMLAPGASTVIVKNPAAFAIRYPGVPIAGNYGADNLGNGGEEVKLSFGAGVPIIQFIYDDAAPWPATPDGSGPTLELINPSKPNLNHGDAAEWRASSQPNGSPGGSSGMTYDTWAAGYPGIGNRDNDPDGDGFSNRLEYALAGDPNSSDSSLSPTAQFTSISGQTYATLTFTRRTEAEDTTFAVQFSPDLLTWTIPGVLVSSTPGGNGTQTEIWRSADPVSARSRLFGRLLVTTSP